MPKSPRAEQPRVSPPRKRAARKKPAEPAPEAPSSPLEDAAARNTLAVNPLIGLNPRDFGEGAQAIFSTFITQPANAARHLGAYAKALGQVLRGKKDGEAAPDTKDRRFADPAWQHSPVHRRLQQAHATTGAALNDYLDSVKLKPRDRARAKLVASIYIDAIAPSNTLMNPTALKRAIDSGGLSLLKGAKNLVHDLRHNGGLPSSVDKSKFAFGQNICLSPGAVIFRNEVLELIQYAPSTPEVLQRPLVVCPPQVNKFYALDLSPEKSFVKFAVDAGVQVFAVSWRNPTKAQRGWDMSTYVEALDEAVDVARKISGSPDVSLWGACSGGMTVAAYLGWLAATGQGGKVVNVISPVCVLDPTKTADTTMGLLVTPESLKALRATVKKRGYVDGNEMARVFAWLRPNDLIWNYWVNNYLMGNDPPAFDILFWNADTTRLPAAFHSDLLAIFEHSPFVNAGKMVVMDEPIDMQQVKVDAYIVAGITDHITPWKACYDTARIYGPGSEFVLANAGHLQSLLNPPGAPKAYFFAGKATAADGDAWAAGAGREEGSWWPHWFRWISARSGERVVAPKKPGNRKYRPMEAAPGTYVLEA
ncbi:alpha/beta fold hydrolase [Paucibacter sp. R3-3]|uniref:Alpha/beta fold hydrolase n=1 Tax=Roseateles agri TaxID=3098619 RepID=A0ABU5DD78_9BURK|nr:alpha/beta fold hydrolase [Paucibacter sp. R3-3]MDY0743234.1 alpha/beta fold hydrolase [Paucibacter sp. R3-3]